MQMKLRLLLGDQLRPWKGHARAGTASFQVHCLRSFPFLHYLSVIIIIAVTFHIRAGWLQFMFKLVVQAVGVGPQGRKYPQGCQTCETTQREQHSNSGCCQQLLQPK